MNDKLKPCPSCGAKNTPECTLITELYDHDKYKYGKCFNCGIKMYNWNTRPIEDALQARIDELEALLKTGWQLYEKPEPKPEHPAINGYNRYDYIPVEGIRQPKPEPEQKPEPQPAYAVGDCVEFRDIEGIKHGIIDGRREEYSVLYNGVSQSVEDKFIIRKLSPSEVKISVTLEGTVSKDCAETLDNFILNNADGHTRNRIKLSTIDPAAAELVRELVAKQEEE